MPSGSPCTLDEVLVEPAPAMPAAADLRRAEQAAFLGLSQTLAHQPELAAQRLVESALSLTLAESSGLSVVDVEAGRPVFRWLATSGEFARYLNGTMPRHYSPCGAVLERRCALFMRDPVRHYTYMNQVHVPVHNLLLVPFGRRGRLVGTVWVVAHRPENTFDSEDLRVVQGLATFASSLLDAGNLKAGGGDGTLTGA